MFISWCAAYATEMDDKLLSPLSIFALLRKGFKIVVTDVCVLGEELFDHGVVPGFLSRKPWNAEVRNKGAAENMGPCRKLQRRFMRRCYTRAGTGGSATNCREAALRHRPWHYNLEMKGVRPTSVHAVCPVKKSNLSSMIRVMTKNSLGRKTEQRIVFEEVSVHQFFSDGFDDLIPTWLTAGAWVGWEFFRRNFLALLRPDGECTAPDHRHARLLGADERRIRGLTRAPPPEGSPSRMDPCGLMVRHSITGYG